MKFLKRFLYFGAVLMLMSSFAACEKNTGEVICDVPFYSLQAAYNQGWISQNDLRAIAGIQSGNIDKELSEQEEQTIRQAYADCYPQDVETDIIIGKYLGRYNSCFAMMIGYSTEQYTQALWHEVIAGIKIDYSNGQRILIWKE